MSEIVHAIDYFMLSATTVRKRVSIFSSNLINLLMTDTSHFAIYVWMVFSDFKVKEELMRIFLLKGHNRGRYIYVNVIQYFIFFNALINKLASITTAGAHNRFLALWKKDKSFMEESSQYCQTRSRRLHWGADVSWLVELLPFKSSGLGAFKL